MTQDHWRRWMLIVREHLVEAGIPHTEAQSFDWRAQYLDGQKPLAAVRAFQSARSK